MSRDLQPIQGASRLSGHRFVLPNVEGCYHSANCCLDMWNDFVEHAAQSWLLRIADAWMQLALVSDNHRRTEQSQARNADSGRLAAAWRDRRNGRARLERYEIHQQITTRVRMASYQVYLLTTDGDVVRAIEFDRADDQDVVLAAIKLRGTDEVEIEIWERRRFVRWLPVPPHPKPGMILDKISRLITLVAMSVGLATLGRTIIKWSVETLFIS